MNLDQVLVFLNQKIAKEGVKKIGLIGELGVGKTHLVRQYLSQINPKLGEQVQSPTFSLCNRYYGPGLEIHHFDLYRIEAEDQLYDLEIFESLNQPQNLTIIEWVNQFEQLESLCDLLLEIRVTLGEERLYRQVRG